MDAFRYTEVHKNESDVAREGLREIFTKMQETNPQMYLGICDFIRSGVQNTPEFQEATREMFMSWKNQINESL